jgi:protein Tex
VRNPLEVVGVGDVVSVRVLGVDTTRGRVQLSMKGTP